MTTTTMTTAITTPTTVCVWENYLLPGERTNHSEGRCVIVGPFKEKYSQFRDKYFGRTRLFDWMKFHYNLLVGAGWLFDSDKISKLKAALIEEGISFETKIFDRKVRVEHIRKKRREQARRYREKKRKIQKE